MTRLARMVVSGLPHHVTQRGNRREPIFFEDGDQEIYRDLLGEQARKADVEVWAYCLMPNHVHLILNPRQADGSAVRWAKHIAATPISSMHGATGRGTCFRAVSRR
jgi:putative transposase